MPELVHTGVMKKLINSPQEVVREALEGMEAAHGDRLRISYEPAYIVRKDAPIKGKVALVSGGGSGHEPMHGGYVGKGMLDAACPGQVFTSPTPDQMYEASKAVNGGAGVLHIVKNYTGDIMNFELAAEMLKSDGIDVETVLTDDDVAVENSLYTAGRRGVGSDCSDGKAAGSRCRTTHQPGRHQDARRSHPQYRQKHGHGPDAMHRAARRQTVV